MKTTKMLAILVLALGLTVEVAKADFTFGTPTNLGPTVNSSAHDYDPSISADELELYLVSHRPGGYGGRYLWVATRASVSDPWAAPVNLGPTVNTAYNECCPDISADGLSLFFWSNRPGGFGSRDLYVTARATTSDPWGPPVNLGPTVNTSAQEGGPTISADDLSLFFFSDRPGGYGNRDLYVTTRETTDDPFGPPVNLGPRVNSSSGEVVPSISADGLSLFFHSDRPGGFGGKDIWVTTRATKEDDWAVPVNLGPAINSSVYDGYPDISSDGRTLFFGSNRSGGLGGDEIWQAPIIPIVDFNGDGIVDSADMCIMVDHWGENYSLCDIGPTPFGDGIVDVQDLIVLAEHLFEEVDDPTLIAHWKLDEAEGIIAYDSAGENNAVVIGDAIWQPAGGMVDGALAFDGTDDYVSTDFVLNPADGVFSVFAWIKGGAPGQAVISQTINADGVNWLSADASAGNLMTELRHIAGRVVGPPLWSQTVITDGNWHRVGFVWDGANRILYADGVEVARDTQPGLGSSEGGLYIGAGSSLDSSSFFSGLIDDVRIYNRVVSPQEYVLDTDLH